MKTSQKQFKSVYVVPESEIICLQTEGLIASSPRDEMSGFTLGGYYSSDDPEEALY